MNLIEQLNKSQKNFEITGFSGDEILVERLHELGLRQGSILSVVGQAPFGGPLIVKKVNSFLALRKEEAKCILVKTI